MENNKRVVDLVLEKGEVGKRINEPTHEEVDRIISEIKTLLEENKHNMKESDIHISWFIELIRLLNQIIASLSITPPPKPSPVYQVQGKKKYYGINYTSTKRNFTKSPPRINQPTQSLEKYKQKNSRVCVSNYNVHKQKAQKRL